MISMKTPERIEKEKIAHLNWCLEKLKFYEKGSDTEDFEQIYRYICEMITVMDGMEAIAASKYYHQRLKDSYLVQQLQHYNIELSV